MRHTLIALKAIKPHVKPGDRFEVNGPQAQALIAIGSAKHADAELPAEPPAPAPEPPAPKRGRRYQRRDMEATATTDATAETPTPDTPSEE